MGHMSQTCLVCGEKAGGTGLSPEALCPACGKLLDWFRAFYAAEPFLDLSTITTETRFIDFLADSLDYVEWVVEAEEHFGVVISDRDTERLRTVGDYLRFIRANMGGGTPSGGWSSPYAGSEPMWDRELDA
jgi:acyl carrier protein